jgi:hypothetical protein
MKAEDSAEMLGWQDASAQSSRAADLIAVVGGRSLIFPNWNMFAWR